MNGLGGSNSFENGVGIGLVGKAGRNQPGLNLIVFPEYALRGLDRPEVAAFKATCRDNGSKITDGMGCGFKKPTRFYAGPTKSAAE